MLAEIASNITIEPSAIYRGLPAAADRTAWENLPEDLRTALIAEGENYLGYAYPQILATDYMEFTRTGNRVHYEDKQFARRTALCALVLAECVEYKGRFLDDIVNGIFLICEESGWQLPAHNSADGPQMPLPDVTAPVVDLFAAETAAVLGVAEYLLRDALANVSPAISTLVNDNLRKRIFVPYLTKYFWWMGNGSRPLNNWTPWCTQNVLLAAFTREPIPAVKQNEASFSATATQTDGSTPECGKTAVSTTMSRTDGTAAENTASAAILPPDWKDRVFRQACVSLDYFLADYEDDGCCDEGAQYFGHAALTLFESLEVLNDITGGRFSGIYREPKIRNMAAYIQNVHVAGPYYLNFADCSPLAGRRGVREYLFGKRTGNDALAEFAARDYAESTTAEKLAVEEHNLFYRAQAVFCHEEMMAAAGSPSAAAPPDIFYPSTGLFIARDDHFCLAVKAGDNDDNHNHNDTGSFIIYKDGQPLFIDLGVESYTQKTFSDRRYEIWTMQSAWHNLPTIGGVMQAAGPQYAASSVTYQLNATLADNDSDRKKQLLTVGAIARQQTYTANSNMRQQDILDNDTQQDIPDSNMQQDAAGIVMRQDRAGESRISMDIAPAYPDSRIRSYVRTAVLEKGRRIVIRDAWELAEPMPVVLTLLTCEKPVLRSYQTTAPEFTNTAPQNHSFPHTNIKQPECQRYPACTEAQEERHWLPSCMEIKIGALAACRVKGAEQITIEEIPITDPRLAKAWPKSIYRILITAGSDSCEIEIT